MGRFRQWLRQERAVDWSPPNPQERVWALPGGVFMPSGGAFTQTAGVDVTVQSALRNGAVSACQRVLVATISKLPVDTVRADGKVLTVVTSPPGVRRPSASVSQRGWVAQNIRSLVSCSNAYGKVVATDALGRATQVETVSPQDVTWRTIDNEEVPYLNQKRQTLYPLGDFWHFPASQFLRAGSRVAMSVTDLASTAIGTALAAEQFGAQFFSDGAHPSAMLTANTDLTKEQAQDIKDAFMATHRGNREPFVKGSDLTYAAISENLTDSQFIQLLEFECLNAARFWGVPPAMIYASLSGSNIKYTNATASDLDFLKYSVETWLLDLEDAWSDLIAQPHSVKFRTSEILKMDDLLRNQLQGVKLANCTMSVNEGRIENGDQPWPDDKFNKPGLPAGDKPVSPLQVGATAGALKNE